MNNYTKRKKENIPLQRFIIIPVFISCIFKIWITEQCGDELWINTHLVFLYANTFVYKGISTVLFCVNIFFVIMFLRRLSLTDRRNYYVSFLYMLLCFIFPKTLTLWSMAVGVCFITGMLLSLFDLNETKASSRIFMYGLLCGLLSLVYFPCLLFLFFVYIAIIREKLYSLHLFFLPVMGVILVYIYLLSGFYLLDKTDMIYNFQTMVQSQINVAIGNLFDFLDTINVFFFLLIMIVLLGLFAIFKLLQKSKSEVVYKRRKYYLLIVLLCFQAVFTLFFHIPYSIMAQVLIILLSILLCLSMSYAKKKTLYMLFYIILFAISFYINFF
jgi:hypothetical protein